MLTLRKKRFWGGFALLLGIVLAPLLMYSVGHMLVTATPDMYVGYTPGPILVTLAIIAIILIVPYWILKGAFGLDHLRNPHSKQPHVEDIPKYSDEVDKP